ncbi:MAG: flavin reductase family protein [Elusimicrobia bacterium]|nr:flavin reductase family protein [Candidatus Liberimonas magnetica]
MDLKALEKISYGMYIVGSKNADKLNAQVATTVIQITAEPAKITACLHRDNLTHQFIRDSKVFSVSVLEQDVPMTFIGHFGFKSGKTFNKFENMEYKKGVTGAPVITANSLAFFECELESCLDAGTHTVFVGRVVEAQCIKDGIPLTYDYYHKVKKGKSQANAPTFIKQSV